MARSTTCSSCPRRRCTASRRRRPRRTTCCGNWCSTRWPSPIAGPVTAPGPHAHPGRGHRAGRRVPAVRARAGGGVRAGGVRRQRRDGGADRGRGPARGVAGFVAALRDRPPALAVVTGVDVSPGRRRRATRPSRIAPSTAHGPRTTLVSPDTATCADCLRELFDPADRRYRYPFINCTNCGPRFTIVTGVPVRPAATTMAPFPMCADCAREYARPGGPAVPRPAGVLPGVRAALRCRTAAAGADATGDPIAAAAAALRAGRRRRRQGPRRLPPRRPRRRRDRGRRAARAQAPGGQAVRRPGPRPRRRPGPGRDRRRSRSRR